MFSSGISGLSELSVRSIWDDGTGRQGSPGVPVVTWVVVYVLVLGGSGTVGIQTKNS